MLYPLSYGGRGEPWNLGDLPKRPDEARAGH